MTPVRLLGLALVLLLAVIPRPASADKTAAQRKAAARAVWKEGVTAYQQGDFDRAVERFEEAYALDPLPSVLFNLGQAYRRKGDAPRALENLRSYLEKKPDAKNRKLVEDLIHELEATVSAQPPPPEPPTPPAPLVAPPAAVADRSPPASRKWYSDRVGLALAGGGLLAAGIGVGLLVHSSSLAGEARDTKDVGEALDRNDSAGTYRTAGAIVVGVGVATLSAGIVKLVFLRKDRGGPASEPTVGFSAGPGFVAVGGSF